MTEEIKSPNIYQLIQAIMRDCHYVRKGDKMVNNQYTFVSHDAVTGAIHPLLVKHGVVIIPTVKDCKRQTINCRVWDKFAKKEVDKTMNETELTVTIDVVNVDVPADRLTLEYPGLGLDFGDKSIGKAISYAYKYALLKLFALETGDDPEKDNVEYPAVDYAAELTKYIGMAVDVDSLREAMSAFQKHYNISIQGDAGLLQMVTAKREEIERMSAIENSENRQNPPKQEEK